MSYPVDIEAAKSTKLFKKFMQSKNKSISISGPKIQNIDINRKQFSDSSMVFQKIKNPTSPKNQIIQKQNTYINQSYNFTRPQTIKRSIQTNIIEQPKRQTTYKQTHYQYQSIQRKTIPPPQQKFQPKSNTEIEKKYQKLLQEYNELKQKLSHQRKQSKKQIIKLQQQVQSLNKKVFQLRNKQDQYILQSKRLKQKSQTETKQKLKLQQSNRQLVYQIQQLKDMLDGQQNSSKKKQDESVHWKKIIQDLRQKNRELQQEIVKLKDLNNVAEREKFVSVKEVANKQLHLNQMREKINSLITENGNLRDQIFHITGKLYHFQQENRVLRADIKRHSDQFPMSYLHEQVQAARVSRPQQSYSQHLQGSGQKPRAQQPPQNNEKRGQRRRGQFARQRGTRKIQPQTNTQQTEQALSQKQQQQQQSKIPNKDFGQAVRKLQQLNQQLQKILDIKVMNGATRRQKINIQRQIQQLQQIVKNQS